MLILWIHNWYDTDISAISHTAWWRGHQRVRDIARSLMARTSVRYRTQPDGADINGCAISHAGWRHSQVRRTFCVSWCSESRLINACAKRCMRCGSTPMWSRHSQLPSLHHHAPPPPRGGYSPHIPSCNLIYNCDCDRFDYTWRAVMRSAVTLT